MTSVMVASGEKKRDCDSRAKDNYLQISLLYLLFLPLPIIDSLNGMMNGGTNDGILSLGMVYRLIILAYCCVVLAQGIIPKRFLVLAVSILLFVILPHTFDLISGSFLSLTVKSLLPIICIETFIKTSYYDYRVHSRLDWLVKCWSFLFPLAILIPFVLGIGFQTYGEGTTGYKGFFYAQNDLCFVLSVLFFFTCGKLFRRLTFFNVLQAILLGFCIVLLGMKSGYILMLVSILYWIMRAEMTTIRRLVTILMICLVFLTAMPLISEAMSSVVDRWMYFSNVSSSFLDFFSSGRLERIPIAFEYCNASEVNPAWFLFGTGMRYGESLAPFGLIEMDPFDLFFQFGLPGVLLIIGYYLSFLFLKLPDGKGHYRMALAMAFVLSVAAGHVLNSALSAMIFAVLCGLAWTTHSERVISYEEGENAI